MTAPGSRQLPDGQLRPTVLCLIKLLLALLAAGALPVGRKVFEGHAVMFGRVIDIAANTADVLP